MGKRQREWARLQRRRIVSLLGGVCAACGTDQDLELDLIKPGTKHHAHMDPSWRMAVYRDALSSGNLQILCSHCNSLKGDSLLTLDDLRSLRSNTAPYSTPEKKPLSGVLLRSVDNANAATSIWP
jgi:5-methylcytosine-specific restriction endonuclease McrA